MCIDSMALDAFPPHKTGAVPMGTYTVEFKDDDLNTILDRKYSQIYVRQTCKRPWDNDYTHNNSEKEGLRRGIDSYTLVTDSCKKDPSEGEHVHNVEVIII